MRIALRLFATVREAAGRGHDTIEVPDGAALDAVLAAAVTRYGAQFAAVLAGSGVWVNGDEPDPARAAALRDGDEVAILPPVSGGA